MPKVATEAAVEDKKAAKKAGAKAAKAKAVEAPAAESKPRGPMGQPAFDSLSVLVDGKKRTHTEIAAVTGRTKGNCLRELEEAGHVSKSTVEGTRGYMFQITAPGKAAFNEAKKAGMTTEYKS
jgi:DNA-binding MarR family transcriptional regulator